MAIYMEDINELIIIEVEKYPIIYNPLLKNYKDSKKKEQVWEEIGRKLDMDGSECLKRWKGVRDTFVRYRRADAMNKNGSGAKSTAKWKYGAVMEFLIPYVKSRQSFGNITQEEDVGDSMADEAFFNEPASAIDTAITKSPTTQSPNALAPLAKRHKRAVDVIRQELLDSEKDKDESALFAEGLVPILRRLTDRQRGVAKLRIQQVLFDIEFTEVEESYITQT